MENSDKSNPRAALGAQRARNKTVVMGADQLQALRHEVEVFSPEKEVADLLGVVDSLAEPGRSEDIVLDNSLLDALSGEDVEGEGDQSAELAQSMLAEDLMITEEHIDFGDALETLPDDDDGAQSESLRAESLHDAGEEQTEYELGMEGHGSAPFEADDSADEQSRASEIMTAGSLMELESEVADEMSAPEADGAALDMKEIPGVVGTPRKPHKQTHHGHHNRLKRPSRDALVGFLVCFDTDPRGSFVELREGRMMVTSESVGAAPCLVLPDPSVSPMHAIMKIVSGEPLHILDQLSEFGTRIWHSDSGREEHLSGDKGLAGHGDVVYFGERKFHVCLVSIEIEGNE